MVKKIAILLCTLVLLLIVVEVIALIRLGSSVDRYAKYWKDYPATGEFVYVVLGDSAAQSIGATRPQLGYVSRLAKMIEQKTGKTVRIVNLSVSGATVKDVAEQQVPRLKDYQPDLITVEVGGNDIVRNPPDQFEPDYRALVEQLPKGVVVANIPYFGGRIRKNDQAIAASKHIEELADEYGFSVVDLQAETRKRDSPFNYASDLFHPSNYAYGIWADAFWKSIEPKL